MKIHPLLQVCARLAAEDMFTFSQIANSKILKKGLELQGFEPHNTHTAVSNAVKRYATAVKKDIIRSLEEKLQNGERFSVTLDEATTKNIRRFANFNIHFAHEPPKCIGMVRVFGSLDNELAARMVTVKLSECGLSMKRHVVACTTDAASVMVAMGEKLPTLHQLCYAHGIHLAVVAVLYQVGTIHICRPGQIHTV